MGGGKMSKNKFRFWYFKCVSTSSVSGKTLYVTNDMNNKSEQLTNCKRGSQRKVVNSATGKDLKRLRNSGASYVARNGNIIQNKNAPDKICDCSCQFLCAKFTLEEIQKRYLEFYKLNYNEQSTFLASLMELKEPRRRRVKGDTPRRSTTVNYCLLNSNGEKERVCKKMICHTLQVTQRRVQVLVEKLKSGNNVADQRGQHTNRPHKIVKTEKRSVAEPTVTLTSDESYSGPSSADLNVTEMFNLHKLKYPNTAISCNTYRHMFSTEFKLRFGFPKCETCQTCDKFFIDMLKAERPEQLELIQMLGIVWSCYCLRPSKQAGQSAAGSSSSEELEVLGN